MDWPAHLRETAAHIHRMSQIPGFVEHARHRLKELTRDSAYSQLPALIRELQKEAADAR